VTGTNSLICNITLFWQTVGFKIFQHILVWVEEQTYWIAFRFLTVGFELELYADHDYCMVYWYIYIVLINLAEKKHLRMAMSSGTGMCYSSLS